MLSTLNLPYNKLDIKIKEEIATLENELNLENLKSIYETDEKINCIVLLKDDKLIGFLSYKSYDESLNIFNVAIKEKFQGQGNFKKMIKLCSHSTITLEVKKDNQAVKLYEKCGFVVVNETNLKLEMILFKTLRKKGYAKINLGLNVLAKRNDGFHEVDFLMGIVDLYDIVTITGSSKDDIKCSNLEMENKFENLAYKAWVLYKEKYNLSGSIEIDINKNIPVAAGMAGGSSDCACVITLLNEMYNLNLSFDQMRKDAATLGSDIPFCIEQKLARSQGRGEIITLVENIKIKSNVLVINPGFDLSTAEVYKNHLVEDNHANIEMLINDQENFLDYIGNDLEKTAIKIKPEIGDYIKEVKVKYNVDVMVSGSGPTILAFVSEDDFAQEIYEDLKNKFPKVYLTKIKEG